MVRLKRFVSLLIVIPLFSSCYYDNLEELHPNLSGGAACDTTGTISYANDIVPILTSSCGSTNSCHNGSASIRLDTHAGVHAQAIASSSASCSGLLVLSIKHDPCLSTSQFMPQGGGMLDKCSIEKMVAWVNRGALNN